MRSARALRQVTRVCRISRWRRSWSSFVRGLGQQEAGLHLRNLRVAFISAARRRQLLTGICRELRPTTRLQFRSPEALCSGSRARSKSIDSLVCKGWLLPTSRGSRTHGEALTCSGRNLTRRSRGPAIAGRARPSFHSGPRAPRCCGPLT